MGVIFMQIGLDKATEMFGGKAKEYAKNKKKTRKLVDEALKKASKKGPLEEIWDGVQLLFGIVKDWANGSYTEVPVGSIIAILVGIVYFVSPIDLVPDFIVGVGLLDDAMVLGLVIKQVKSDLDRYEEWLSGDY